jgi:rubrerythrin
MKNFADLSGKEILALAISQEEEDSRIYASFADGLKESFPATASLFEEMAAEEDEHRHRLIELFRKKFGERIPLIRRQDVKGFVGRKPLWLVRPLGLDAVRRQAAMMELETQRFYARAQEQTSDAAIRQLLGDLAEAERQHEHKAEEAEEHHLTRSAREQEDETSRRLFVLQIVQPGLVGLMDGSVSTLAPLFAAAFATQNSWDAFRVGLAASVGAGISMGFAEALADDGKLSGRGTPWLRGLVCGLMTMLGGLGHTLPYLIPSFHLATTVAVIVVVIELGIIAWIRHRYMDTPWLGATFQVMVGGALVFLAGIVIGSS